MFNVSCESTCDLPFEYLKERNCEVLFYTYTVDGVDFDDDMGRNPAALPSLYDAIKTKRPTTSQINVTAYEEFFLKLLQKGDLLHVTFSSGLSQSASNAFKAAENVAKMNLPHKLYVVDSLCGGGGYGLFVDGLLDERDKGATFETLCNRATERRLCVHHFFFSTDLTYFRRSGRVSGAAMLIGNLLKICPVMRVKEDGKIVAYTKTISSKKAVAKLAEEIKANATEGENYNGKLWIQHSNCWATAYQTKETLEKIFPNVSEIKIFDVGTVMACHCGPDTVAIYFWGKKRCY